MRPDELQVKTCCHEYPDRGSWTCQKCGYEVPKNLVSKISQIDKGIRKGGSLNPVQLDNRGTPPRTWGQRVDA